MPKYNAASTNTSVPSLRRIISSIFLGMLSFPTMLEAYRIGAASTTKSNVYGVQNLILIGCDANKVVKKEYEPYLHQREPGFNGTVMHINIANHYYDTSLAILKTFPEEKDTLLLAQDKNGRTPLHLALEIGAPADLVCKLITKDNVLLPDINGVTPLMLAARGGDLKIAKTILEIVGTKINRALKAKDNKGRTVLDWNKMDVNDLFAGFHAVEVNGYKDAGASSNTFFQMSPQYPTIANLMFLDPVTDSNMNNEEKVKYRRQRVINYKDTLREVGFEIGSSYIQGSALPAICATKANAEKLLAIAEDKTPTSDSSPRYVLARMWDIPANEVTKLWDFIGSQMRTIIPELAGIRIADVYKVSQQEIGKLIKHYQASNQERQWQNKVCASQKDTCPSRFIV